MVVERILFILIEQMGAFHGDGSSRNKLELAVVIADRKLLIRVLYGEVSFCF